MDEKDILQVEDVNTQDTTSPENETCGNEEYSGDGTAADLSISLSNRKKEFISWVWTIVAAAAVFAILLIFAAPGVVSGSSMEPTYYSGDRFLLIRDWLIDDYEYGDIVCGKFDGSILIKRVIGKPGDHIQIMNGCVYRNGEKLEEDYVLTPTYAAEEASDIIVGEGEYYLLGDNRGGSMDSRVFGPCKDIEGRTWFFFRRLWFK